MQIHNNQLTTRKQRALLKMRIVESNYTALLIVLRNVQERREVGNQQTS